MSDGIHSDDEEDDSGWARRTVSAPKGLASYMAHMGAVDIFDQTKLARSGSLELNMISNKWWHKLFWGLLDMAITNAWIVKKQKLPKKDVNKYKRKNFLQDLAHQLCNNKEGVGLDGGAVRTPGTPISSRKASRSTSTVSKTLDMNEAGATTYADHTTASIFRVNPEIAKSEKLMGRKKYIQGRCQACKFYNLEHGFSWKSRPPSETLTYCTKCKVWLDKPGASTKYNPEGGRGCWEIWHEEIIDKIKAGVAKGDKDMQHAKAEWNQKVADINTELDKEKRL